MLLFQNSKDYQIILIDKDGESVSIDKNAKIVLDAYFRKYAPEYLRPIRQEPSSDYIELTSRPLDPVPGQYFLDINKQKLFLSVNNDTNIDWKVVAEQTDNNWEWIDEGTKAPNVTLPSIGELGQLGKRKLNI